MENGWKIESLIFILRLNHIKTVLCISKTQFTLPFQGKKRVPIFRLAISVKVTEMSWGTVLFRL